MQDHQDRNTHKGKQNNHKRETKIKQKTQDLLLLELDNDAQDLINLSHLLDKENQNNEKKIVRLPSRKKDDTPAIILTKRNIVTKENKKDGLVVL